MTSVVQIEAKLELRLEHIERDERLNVFDREELRFNLFREVFEETALELKVRRLLDMGIIKVTQYWKEVVPSGKKKEAMKYADIEQNELNLTIFERFLRAAKLSGLQEHFSLFHSYVPFISSLI